jgi:hypothetical protein
LHPRLQDPEQEAIMRIVLITAATIAAIAAAPAAALAQTSSRGLANGTGSGAAIERAPPAVVDEAPGVVIEPRAAIGPPTPIDPNVYAADVEPRRGPPVYVAPDTDAYAYATRVCWLDEFGRRLCDWR